MNTQCNGMQLEFQDIGRRKVQVAFDGGHITADGNAFLRREMDRCLGLIKQLAQCFTDYRTPGPIVHSVEDYLDNEFTALLRLTSEHRLGYSWVRGGKLKTFHAFTLPCLQHNSVKYRFIFRGRRLRGICLMC